MSYYDYEPNSSYYYDEYPEYHESDMPYDEPVYVDLQVSQHKRFAHSNGSYSSSKSFISSTRNSRHNYYIVSQENIPDENQYNMPHYVVPVVYAPSKVVSLVPNKPVKNRSVSHESIDKYFSDDKNIQRGTSAYKRIIRKRIPRDVIREEPEYLTSCSESIQFSEKERSDTEISEREDQPKPEKRSQSNDAKRNPAKEQESKAAKGKKLKSAGEGIEDHKKEEDPKKKPSEVVCEPNLDESKEKLRHPPRRSQSTLQKKVFLSHISHMPISCIPSKDNAGKVPLIKHSKSDTKLDLQKVENAKGVPNATKSKNAKIDYYSISDITQCMNSNDKTKLLGWRNKSISEESTTNNTSSVPSDDVSKLSNVASKNSENSIDINTAEYEEFISSIIEKPLKTDDSSHSHFMSKIFNKSFKFDKSDQSLDFRYEIDDAPVAISVTPTAISTTMTPIANLKVPERESQTEIEVKTTVSVGKNMADTSKTKPVLQVPKLETTKDNTIECRRPKMIKTNPLTELDISSRNLFRYDVSEDFREDRFNSGREGNCADKSSRRKAFFMKLIRYLGNFITSVRNISYKYVFRYILFI